MLLTYRIQCATWLFKIILGGQVEALFLFVRAKWSLHLHRQYISECRWGLGTAISLTWFRTYQETSAFFKSGRKGVWQIEREREITGSSWSLKVHSRRRGYFTGGSLVLRSGKQLPKNGLKSHLSFLHYEAPCMLLSLVGGKESASCLGKQLRLLNPSPPQSSGKLKRPLLSPG